MPLKLPTDINCNCGRSPSDVALADANTADGHIGRFRPGCRSRSPW